MPSRKKIDLAKVRDSLFTPCPNCGHKITPAEIKRVSSEEMECPACGSRFQSGQIRQIGRSVKPEGNVDICIDLADAVPFAD